MAFATNLIYSKYHKPPLSNVLIRSQLIQQLDQSLLVNLTLVCAPAGFGKTTLVNSWLEQSKLTRDGNSTALNFAWLSLDEDDSDFSVFLHYLIAGLRTVFESAGTELLEMLHTPIQPSQKVLFTALINEFEQIPTRFMLVLDDYHTISDQSVHSLMVELLRYCPPHIHLILISRSNPPFPLASLHAKGQLVEIRSRDLRLTLEESSRFLKEMLPTPLSETALVNLHNRTEGWIVGLRLAALSLASEGAKEVLTETTESDNYTADYLMDEILSRQPPHIQEFLMMTSILNRFSVELCETIIKGSEHEFDAHALITWLENANLFVTLLDNNRKWYRYHALFQELLQVRLHSVMPGKVAELHRRAAAWLAAKGLLDEALRHALAANDHAFAARVMAQELRDVLNREDRLTLERRLRFLSDEIIRFRPDLLLIKAWVFQFLWQFPAMLGVIKQVELLIADNGEKTLTSEELAVVQAQISALNAQVTYFRNQPDRVIELSEESLTGLPASWSYVRGGALLYLCLAMQATGKGYAAQKLVRESYTTLTDKNTSFALRHLMIMCFVHLLDGQLDQAYQVAQTMLQLSEQAGLRLQWGWAHYFLGEVAYQRNDLETAYRHFEEVINNRYVVHLINLSANLYGLVLSSMALGKNVEAWQSLELLSQSNLMISGAEDERTRSLRARLQLLEDDLESALRWADGFTSPPPDQPLLWLEEPHLTRVRVLLARGHQQDIILALQTLEALHEIALRTFKIRFQIEILALRALAFDMQGIFAREESLAALRESLQLARQGGFVRIFVDLGPPMQTLLRIAAKDDPSPALQHILSFFPDPSVEVTPLYIPHKFRELEEAPVERLTGRELDILSLLRERMSDKEIAQRLSLSTATVKRHTANIYGKLGVNRRWDAVNKAETIGILPRN